MGYRIAGCHGDLDDSFLVGSVKIIKGRGTLRQILSCLIFHGGLSHLNLDSDFSYGGKFTSNDADRQWKHQSLSITDHISYIFQVETCITMDLAEMMKTFMAKEAGLSAAASIGSSVAGSGVSSAMLAGAAASTTGPSSNSQASSTGTPFGTTYITEKLYTVLQMYLQHKGWNSVELLQCFAEMKEAAMIPNAAAYLQ